MRCTRILVLLLGVCGILLLGDSNVRIVQLSLVSGGVEVQLPDGHGWRPALLDAPVTANEQVRTGAAGRAEIQFEDGSTVRIAPNSEVSFDQLVLRTSGQRSSRVSLLEGTGFVSLYNKADGADFHFAVPGGEITADSGTAIYRVDLTGTTAPVLLRVYDGKTTVAYGKDSYALKASEMLTLGAGATPRVASLKNDAGVDPLTRWSLDRDQWFESAFTNGAQNAPALTSAAYQGWYGAMGGGPIPPLYSTGGLMYIGAPGCPWTLSPFNMPFGGYSGFAGYGGIGGLGGLGYSSWCWSPLDGWFEPLSGIEFMPTFFVPAYGGETAAPRLSNTLAAGAGTHLPGPQEHVRQTVAPRMAPSLVFANSAHLLGATRANEIAAQYRAPAVERSSAMFYAKRGGEFAGHGYSGDAQRLAASPAVAFASGGGAGGGADGGARFAASSGDGGAGGGMSRGGGASGGGAAAGGGGGGGARGGGGGSGRGH